MGVRKELEIFFFPSVVSDYPYSCFSKGQAKEGCLGQEMTDAGTSTRYRHHVMVQRSAFDWISPHLYASLGDI